VIDDIDLFPMISRKDNPSPEELENAVRVYIDRVKNQSPIVSTSHVTYGAMIKRYGEAFQTALDAYFDSLPPPTVVVGTGAAGDD
tara:strand:+ start:1875 stop:2129 length:255 start_codon:yes stop_codon:yes gene_type:complete